MCCGRGATNGGGERAQQPVDLQVAPNRELFYVDFDGGRVFRVTYTAGSQPPIAVASADRTTGALPLTVQFDGSTSDDPDSSSPLTFAWDLDGDGQFDDSTTSRPSCTYTTAGTYTARLKVTDAGGATATDSVSIAAGNTRPTATIVAPSPGVAWKSVTRSSSKAPPSTSRTGSFRRRRCRGRWSCTTARPRATPIRCRAGPARRTAAS